MKCEWLKFDVFSFLGEEPHILLDCLPEMKIKSFSRWSNMLKQHYNIKYDLSCRVCFFPVWWTAWLNPKIFDFFFVLIIYYLKSNNVLISQMWSFVNIIPIIERVITWLSNRFELSLLIPWFCCSLVCVCVFRHIIMAGGLELLYPELERLTDRTSFFFTTTTVKSSS